MFNYFCQLTKVNKERFFAGIPKVKPKDKDKMEIYQLFLQHIIASLKDDGKAAIVVPTGFITAHSGIDKKIRQHLVDKKMLSGVISMPSNIFATTGTNVSILILDKSNVDNIILIDASNLGGKIKDGKNQKTVLTQDEEEKIIKSFNERISTPDFSVLVTYNDIIAKEYSLSAGQFVEIKTKYINITPELFAKTISEKLVELSSLMEQSHLLEPEITKVLSELKYD